MYRILIIVCFCIGLVFDLIAIDSKAAEVGKSIKSYVEAITKVPDSIEADDLLKVLPHDRVLGNKNAPVLMIEYASYTCQHCADFNLKIFPDIEKKYIQSGKVRYVFRNYPFDFKSLKAAMLGFCYVNNNEYFNYNKAVFSSSLWSLPGKDLGVLENIAKISNVDDKNFKFCITNEKIMEYVVQEKFLAIKKLNVNATPTFFINGKRYDGDYSFNAISELFEQIIKSNPNYSTIK